MNPSPAAPHLLGSTILVVDDSLMSQQLLTSMLNRYGFTSVVCANDGIDALKQLPVYKPELIILDLLMPRMDGFTFCTHLRSMPDFCTIPVILQTAKDDEEVIDKAFDHNITDMVTKPIVPGVLISKILEHLEVRHHLSEHTAP